MYERRVRYAKQRRTSVVGVSVIAAKSGWSGGDRISYDVAGWRMTWRIYDPAGYWARLPIA